MPARQEKKRVATNHFFDAITLDAMTESRDGKRKFIQLSRRERREAARKLGKRFVKVVKERRKMAEEASSQEAASHSTIESES